ncbi:MAG: GDP-mannose 4,6-dehydratase [Thaumarchaeota archaeon]|nr:GDP-mannose 4,6-dehydratase [Nitrososphaerota archaeon]
MLVTGSSGFLGQRLSKTLSRMGAKVVGIDVREPEEFSFDRLATAPKILRTKGDVLDGRLLAKTLRKHSIETVFHLAAQSIVERANENPSGAFDVNVRGTLAVLEACRNSPSVELVQSSSDHVYGECSDGPATEDREFRSLYPYDVSKSCADMITRSYSVTYGMRAAITRCANIYGEGDLNWSRVVPGTIRAILEGRIPVIRSDGEFVRDYIYVEDAVSAYLTLAEKLAADSDLSGEAFNFSNGHPLKVIDVVNKVSRLMGSYAKPTILNEASNEIRCLSISPAKAKRSLGWEARFSMDEGVERTIRFYEEFLGEQTGKSNRQM